MAKNILTDEIKQFIVQQLACFDTCSQVAKQCKEEFGIDIERGHVNAYDPTKRQGQQCAKKWKELFAETRKRFLEDTSTIPIANQAFRLTKLNELYEKVAKQGNTSMAASLLEQASKETGGMFTNRQKIEHTGKDGGIIQTAVLNKEEFKLARKEMLEKDDC